MSESNKNLRSAVAATIADAQASFTISDGKPEIKRSVDALGALLREWRAQSKLVERTVVGLIRMMQSRCDHADAQRGYNERDGSWMNPCPTCGHSE